MADAERLVEQLRAVAEPNRPGTIALLRGTERCICQTEAALGLSQSLVSNHLRVLSQAGLVQVRRDSTDARWIHDRLDRDAVERLLARLAGVLDLSAFDPRPAVCTPAGRPVRSS